MFSFDYKNYLQSLYDTTKIIIKTILPLFILAELLNYFELLNKIAFIFEPVSRILNLPADATLAIMSGVFINLYGAIALGASIELNVYEWTVLGLFLGVAHSLPIESAILKKIGISWIFSITFRILMAFLVILPLQLIPKDIFFDNPDKIQTIIQPIINNADNGFINFLYATIINGLTLAIEIIILVALVLIVNQILKNSKFLKKINKNISPFVALISGFLLGILYGSSILIKEAKNLSKKQIISISCFLMVAHAMIEDPLLFVLFGANIYVLIFFRIILAIIVVLIIWLLYDRLNKYFQ